MRRIWFLFLIFLISLLASPVLAEEYYGWDPKTGSSDSQIQLDVTGVRDSTSCSLYNTSTGSKVGATTLSKGEIWTKETSPGDLIRLECSDDVAAYLGDHGWASKVYYPTVNGSLVGTGFVFQAIESNYDGDTRFYAPENAASVTVTNLNSGSTTSFNVDENLYNTMSLTAGDAYEVTSDSKIIVENTAGNAFEMAPASGGGMKGQEFYGTTSNWERGAYAIYSYNEPVQVDVYSLSTSGSSLYKSYTLQKDSRIYESGTGTEEFRFVANNTISVWVGDTEGGDSVRYMGDDYSITRVEPGEYKMIGAGRHNPNLVIIGTDNNTDLSVDGSHYTIQKNEIKKFSTAPPHTYNISSDKPVIAQSMAGNGFNDQGTYLLNSKGQTGLCDSRGPENQCISTKTHLISSKNFNISSIFEAQSTALMSAKEGAADLSISNKSFLSGLWRGSFNITAEKTVINPGAGFYPVNGRIIIN